MTPAEIALLVLTIVFGLLLFGPTVYAFFGFVHTHLLHRSTIKSYIYSPESYAVVTGASDGIGKGLARELLKLGFNVVIHGRNPAKLDGVKAELEGLGTGKDVRTWVSDAGAEQDWEGVPQELQGLQITVLINNVGGATPPTVSLDQQPWSFLQTVVNVNAVFPMGLTRVLLPSMRALARPTVILYTGSMAGEVPAPYLTVYSASKAFLDMFVRSLDMQERELVKSKVQFHLLQTGSVMSGNGFFKTPSWDRPTADDYAKAYINVVGCGKRKICPWWGHAFERWMVGLFTERTAESVMVSAMEALKKQA